MSNAAKRPELEALHDALARELAVAIKETEIKVIDVPDGEGTKKVAVRTRNAAVLNAARQFLKDNGIECAPGHPSEPVKSLAEKLPFPATSGERDGDTADA